MFKFVKRSFLMVTLLFCLIANNSCSYVDKFLQVPDMGPDSSHDIQRGKRIPLPPTINDFESSGFQ